MFYLTTRSTLLKKIKILDNRLLFSVISITINLLLVQTLASQTHLTYSDLERCLPFLLARAVAVGRY